MARLLLINPNTSASVTELLARHARAASPPGTILTAATAPFGAPYISDEASATVGAQAVRAAWDADLQAHGEPDAVLLGCFGDPGVDALRALTRRPVLGLAEVAMRTAMVHGRYAIVTGGAAWRPMLARLAAQRGLDQALAGIVTVEPTGAQLLADPAAAHALLLQACRDALALGGVQALVLGGAALADMAMPLQPLLPVPLINNVSVGMAAAWHAACTRAPD